MSNGRNPLALLVLEMSGYGVLWVVTLGRKTAFHADQRRSDILAGLVGILLWGGLLIVGILVIAILVSVKGR